MNRAQQSLRAELDEVIGLLELDPDEVDSVRRALRTTYLETIKRQHIVGAILSKYLLMDEHLSCVMCWYFFGTTRTFPQQWRSNQFKAFNYHVLEKLYLQQKLEFVRAVYGLPNRIVGDLMALNDLRNALAHSLFPENRRRKPEWKGQPIFEVATVRRFLEDMEYASHYFFRRFWKRTRDYPKPFEPT